MPGMPTSSTITSGRDADALLGLGGAARLVHLDLNVLERRPQELAEPGIVVDQQQAHSFPPDRKALSKVVSAAGTGLSPDLLERGAGRAAAGASAAPGGGQVRSIPSGLSRRRSRRGGLGTEHGRGRRAALAVAQAGRVQIGAVRQPSSVSS